MKKKRTAKRSRKKTIRKKAKKKSAHLSTLEYEFEYYKQHIDKLWDHAALTNNRLQDIEIRTMILTRLIVSVCVERLKINPFGLRRMIRNAEKGVLSASQIKELEKLFKMEARERREK